MHPIDGLGLLRGRTLFVLLVTAERSASCPIDDAANPANVELAVMGAMRALADLTP